MTTAVWNPDAETALISRLLIEPGQVPSVKDRVQPDDFYDGDARAAYEAMLRLDEAGERIDIVTLRSEAGRSLDISLFDITAAHKAPIETYAEIVSRDAWRREFIDGLTGLAGKARRESDPQVLMASLQDKAAELSEGIDRTDVAGRLNLSDHQGEPPPPLLDVLSPFGTTVLYGDGGDGKGWVAAKWAAQIGKKVAIIDFEMQPQEWAYRLSKFGVGLDDVSYFAPAMTLDRWATESAARQLKAEGVEFLLIDSAMYASNVEDPYSPAGALAYGRARRRLNNLPAILLAHTTGGADKVFGSVFWRNESRIVWRLNKDTMTRKRHLLCKKANGYSWLEGRRYEIEYNEQHGILELHEHGKPWTATPVTGDY